jgi:transcriptional regulator GlxA family with amidase domain
MQIAILIFDRLTALDAVGPYEVLSRLPGAELHFVAAEPGPKRTDTGRLVLEAERALGDVIAPEIVVVPGGEGNRPLLRDGRLLGWLRSIHEGTRFTTSVCTGSLLLGAAGILEGRRATSHWAYREALRSFGAEPVPERVVEDGKIITAAGVSAGIDMALHLARKLAGDEVAQAIQLGIEYDPDPPLDAGSPDKAPDSIVEAVRGLERPPETSG